MAYSPDDLEVGCPCVVCVSQDEKEGRGMRLADTLGMDWGDNVELLINGLPVARGTMSEMVKLAEAKAQPGDRLTFLGADWEAF